MVETGHIIEESETLDGLAKSDETYTPSLSFNTKPHSKEI